MNHAAMQQIQFNALQCTHMHFNAVKYSMQLNALRMQINAVKMHLNALECSQMFLYPRQVAMECSINAFKCVVMHLYA